MKRFLPYHNLNVTDVESDVIRNTTNEWWDLQMYNRITNVKTAARVMIMQRTHQADLSGHVLETGGWTHLKLPTRFVASKRCVVTYAEATCGSGALSTSVLRVTLNAVALASGALLQRAASCAGRGAARGGPT